MAFTRTLNIGYEQNKAGQITKSLGRFELQVSRSLIVLILASMVTVAASAMVSVWFESRASDEGKRWLHGINGASHGAR